MKRTVLVLIAVVLILSMAAPTLLSAAESQKGTIKNVDTHAGTITFCPEGTTKDMTLKTDKSVDLSKVKPDMKAEIMMDKDNRVKDIKEMAKPKPMVGC
jgi:hypothetical protein